MIAKGQPVLDRDRHIPDQLHHAGTKSGSEDVQRDHRAIDFQIDQLAVAIVHPRVEGASMAIVQAFRGLREDVAEIVLDSAEDTLRFVLQIGHLLGRGTTARRHHLRRPADAFERDLVPTDPLESFGFQFSRQHITCINGLLVPLDGGNRSVFHPSVR